MNKKILLAIAGICTVFAASITAEFITENTISFDGWEWCLGVIVVIVSWGFIFGSNKKSA